MRPLILDYLLFYSTTSRLFHDIRAFFDDFDSQLNTLGVSPEFSHC